MNKKISLWGTVLSYVGAGLFLLIYFIKTFSKTGVVSAIERLGYMTIVCLLIILGTYIFCKDKQKKERKSIIKNAILAMFTIYAIMLFSYTLFDDYFGRFGLRTNNWSIETFKVYFKYSFNIIPLKTILEITIKTIAENISFGYFLTNIIGNIVAFMPLSIFLPLTFKEIDTFKRFLITVLLISFGIELLQLLGLCGSFDIDDVILNVTGACLLYKILDKTQLMKKLKKIKQGENLTKKVKN